MNKREHAKTRGYTTKNKQKSKAVLDALRGGNQNNRRQQNNKKGRRKRGGVGVARTWRETNLSLSSEQVGIYVEMGTPLRRQWRGAAAVVCIAVYHRERPDPESKEERGHKNKDIFHLGFYGFV